eukprot:938032-Rhodomonas_salina.1
MLFRCANTRVYAQSCSTTGILTVGKHRPQPLASALPSTERLPIYARERTRTINDTLNRKDGGHQCLSSTSQPKPYPRSYPSSVGPDLSPNPILYSTQDCFRVGGDFSWSRRWPPRGLLHFVEV